MCCVIISITWYHATAKSSSCPRLCEWWSMCPVPHTAWIMRARSLHQHTEDVMLLQNNTPPHTHNRVSISNKLLFYTQNFNNMVLSLCHDGNLFLTCALDSNWRINTHFCLISFNVSTIMLFSFKQATFNKSLHYSKCESSFCSHWDIFG